MYKGSAIPPFIELVEISESIYIHINRRFAVGRTYTNDVNTTTFIMDPYISYLCRFVPAV